MKKKLLTLIIALLATSQQSHAIKTEHAITVATLCTTIIGLAAYKKYSGTNVGGSYSLVVVNGNVISSSYTSITPSGKKETKNVILPNDTTSIIANGFGNVVIIENQSADSKLKITADKNVMRHIEHTIQNGTLTVNLDPSIKLPPKTQITYDVSLKKVKSIKTNGTFNLTTKTTLNNIEQITTNGSSGITATVNTNNLNVSVNTVKLDGTVNTQMVTVARTSAQYAGNLKSNIAQLSLNGVSKAEINNPPNNVTCYRSGITSFYNHYQKR